MGCDLKGLKIFSHFIYIHILNLFFYFFYSTLKALGSLQKHKRGFMVDSGIQKHTQHRVFILLNLFILVFFKYIVEHVI